MHGIDRAEKIHSHHSFEYFLILVVPASPAEYRGAVDEQIQAPVRFRKLGDGKPYILALRHVHRSRFHTMTPALSRLSRFGQAVGFGQRTDCQRSR